MVSGFSLRPTGLQRVPDSEFMQGVRLRVTRGILGVGLLRACIGLLVFSLDSTVATSEDPYAEVGIFLRRQQSLCT